MVEAEPIKYFENVASRYKEASARAPWRWIRALELQAVRREISPSSIDEVLELGCGAGFYTENFLSSVAKSIVAVDNSPTMLNNVSGSDGVETVCSPIESLNLKRTFDLIFSAGLLEFLENPRSLFAIASRHAKETSRLFLLAPRDCPIIQFYVLKHRLNSVSVRIINRREMEDLARSEGWFPTRVKPAGPIATASLFSRTA